VQLYGLKWFCYKYSIGVRLARRRSHERSNQIRIIDIALIAVILVLVAYIAYPAIKSAFTPAPAGKTLAGIDTPLTQSQLSVINNAPDSYFESAGEMLMNGSISGIAESNNIYYGNGFEAVLSNSTAPRTSVYTYDSKPSVIYAGAISCIYCGESRWAMAMALSRFGSFNSLYIGYSSFGDADVPTLYWKPNEYKTPNNFTYGNYYSSPYVNFFSAEYDSNITQGFQLPQVTDPISVFVSRAPNASYEEAYAYLNNTKDFQGTPFTIWGNSIDVGAVSVVFGESNNQSATNAVPLTDMTHQQILSQLSSFNTTFAYEEYAGADVYIAQLCAGMNNSAPICKLPAIKAFEHKMGL
jgi:hypothetical protein